MSNNHWIIDKILAAGNRTLAWSSSEGWRNEPPSSTALLFRFLDELESGGADEKEAAEVCPRGASCAGTPKPPNEPFTCMSDDCPLKVARFYRSTQCSIHATAQPCSLCAAETQRLLSRRCVKSKDAQRELQDHSADRDQQLKQALDQCKELIIQRDEAQRREGEAMAKLREQAVSVGDIVKTATEVALERSTTLAMAIRAFFDHAGCPKHLPGTFGYSAQKELRAALDQYEQGKAK